MLAIIGIINGSLIGCFILIAAIADLRSYRARKLARN